MTRTSAGILLYRCREGALEVLLVHPGGPFFGRKDLGNWSIPKGEVSQLDPITRARPGANSSRRSVIRSRRVG